MRRKITVAGAGELALSVIARLAQRDDVDLVVVDTGDGTAGARALDAAAAGALLRYEPRVRGSSDWAPAAGSDAVVLAAAPTGGPVGMAEIGGVIAERCPGAVVLVGAEPVHVLGHAALRATNFPRGRVLGVSAAPTAARLRVELARALRASVQDVAVLVLGGAGELAVPVLSTATVAGVPLRRLLPEDRLQELVERVRRERLPGPATAAAALAGVVDAILGDQARLLPCSVSCRGEYGLEDGYVALPCRVGAGGLSDIIEIDLADDEREALVDAHERARALVRAAVGA